MKGVIFNILEDFISEGWGGEVYEQILGACPLHTKEPFVGPGTYPDADLLAIVGKATEKLDVPTHVALIAFGTYAFPKLAGRYPASLNGHSHPRTFLKTIDDVIHVEVRKLMRDANPPRILCHDLGENRMQVSYQSTRKLCPVFRGLLQGCCNHFEVPISYQETACMNDGAEACTFEVTFLK